jgi:hypothetical protein
MIKKLTSFRRFATMNFLKGNSFGCENDRENGDVGCNKPNEKRNKERRDAMKKLLFISCVIVLAVICAMAAEKKPLKDVDTNAIIKETQVSVSESGDKHVAITWWIPNEFWEAILYRNAAIGETEKKAMLDAMSGISLITVVQADVTSLGAFKFYSKEEIEKKMLITFTDAGGKKLMLKPVQKINPDLEIVLGVFKPILGAAMGNLGNNMHFYVLNDKSKTSLRLLDPYRKGLLSIQLTKRNDGVMTANIEMPLDALFVPRKCPNGKDAHISWKYCPWTGKRLED